MNKRKRNVLNFPIFGILFGVFPVIFIWAENELQVTPHVVLPAVLATLATVILVWLIMALLFRSYLKGSIFSTFLFFLFFSYGHVYNFIKGKAIFGIEIGYVKLAAFYAVIFVVGLILILRIRKFPESLTSILNIVSLALIVFNLGRIIEFQVKTTLVKSSEEAQNVQVKKTGDELPDIYYIILDAYSRADFLKSEYGFDNSAFITALEQRGFYVAKCANSNYDGTLSSLASSLNFEYTNDYGLDESDANTSDATAAGQISNNRLRSELAPLGYQFVTTRGYSAFNDVRDSDIYINVIQDKQLQDSLQKSQFERLYLSTTIARLIFEVYTANPSEHPNIPEWFELNPDFEFLDSSNFWYSQTLYTFDTLERFPLLPDNFLVYAHINAPHGPYVFDQMGNYRYVPPVENDPKYYIDTIVYINKRVLELVDSLIKNSTTPPIIIIQGDHGSHIISGGYDKHKILSAYYLPGAEDALYETITPVNTFRIVLDRYFGKEYELLPDKIYVKVTNEREIHPSQCEYSR
jgi:hypothetical protein